MDYLRELQAAATEADGEATGKPIKSFIDYKPGFVHVDIKYLPQMPDQSSRRYQFGAIDRATPWIFLRVHEDKSDVSNVVFLERLHEAAPMKNRKMLTDNGSQLTDRFTIKTREPSVSITSLGVAEHWVSSTGCAHLATSRPTAWRSRFCGQISELAKQSWFSSAAEPDATLSPYSKTYSEQIPQRALNLLMPIQALKDWSSKGPEHFVKRVKNPPSRDT